MSKSVVSPELHARLANLLDRHTWADLEARIGISRTSLQRAGRGIPIGQEMHSLLRFGLSRIEAENADRARRGLGPIQIDGARRRKCRSTQAHREAMEHARLLKEIGGQRPAHRRQRTRPELPATQTISMVGIRSPMDEIPMPAVVALPPPPPAVDRRDTPPSRRSRTRNLTVRRGRRKNQRRLRLRLRALVGVFVAAAVLGAVGAWVVV